MARHWAPLRDSDVPKTRSRSIVNVLHGEAPSPFGQRPLFSEPGPDQPPPEEGRLGPEARPRDVHPSDRREGSKDRADLVTPESRIPVLVTYSSDNVANPPTKDELIDAFGAKPAGFMGLIIDNGGVGQVWLVVKSKSNTWWFEQLTKAT